VPGPATSQAAEPGAEPGAGDNGSAQTAEIGFKLAGHPPLSLSADTPPEPMRSKRGFLPFVMDPASHDQPIKGSLDPAELSAPPQKAYYGF
jgi:hypothetical protein